MKAKIDNKILNVRIINANYNEYAVECEILEGNFKGAYTIVENTDLIKEKKNFRYYVQRTQEPDLNERRKTTTKRKCETLEEAKKVKSKYVDCNHSNIYSYKILDRITGEYL
jgi:DNA-binding transcriptional regulator YhcF (GntR family)